MNRQPVKCASECSWTSSPRCLANNARKQVLYPLQSIDVSITSATQQAVAIVKSRADYARRDRFRCFCRQPWPDMSESPQVIVTNADYISDVSIKRQR